MDLLTDLAHIDRIVVPLAVGGVVRVVGILEASQYYCSTPPASLLTHLPSLWDCSVVPDVSVVRETVGHESVNNFNDKSDIGQSILASPQLPFLHVLFERIEGRLEIDLNLGIGPSGDLHHHVVHTLACTGTCSKGSR